MFCGELMESCWLHLTMVLTGRDWLLHLLSLLDGTCCAMKASGVMYDSIADILNVRTEELDAGKTIPSANRLPPGDAPGHESQRGLRSMK
jgi:hypothetical protein